MRRILKFVQPRLIYRFISLFMVMALLVAATGSFGIWKMSQLGSHLEGMMKRRAAQEKMAALMKVTAHECQISLLLAEVVSNDMEGFERNLVEYRLKQEWFRQYCDVLLKGDARVDVESAQQESRLGQKVKMVLENWAVFESVAERMLSLKEIMLKANGNKAINKDAGNALKEYKPGALEKEIEEASYGVDKAIDEVLVTVSGMMIETKSEVDTIQQRAKITFIAVIFLAVMLAIMLGMLATRRIIIPLTELDHAANRLAMGDLSFRVRIKSGGEIQKLFDSFNQMAENLEKGNRNLLAAQEELMCKEKLAILGQLSGSVGHELRNPLGVMSNAVYFLKMVLSDADETTKEYLDIIKNEIDNSLRIITDLLDFARTRPPQRNAISPGELVSQSLGRCTIPEDVTVTVDISAALPCLNVDLPQLEQVLTNIIINGVQAMPDGGALRISARKVRGTKKVRGARFEERGNNEINSDPRTFEPRTPISDPHTSNLDPCDDFIEISVADTGEGITPENMKKLFQPLFTTKVKGIGLGLVVCKKLVEANSGRIKVESEFGKGTTFAILLPVERG